MPDDAITPTRIIPAGDPLPAVVGPPHGDEPPPWRRPAPQRDDAPPPQPREAPREEAPQVETPREAPQPVEVIVRYEPGADLEPLEAARPGIWERIWAWIGGWGAALATLLALIPIPPYGYSITTAWAAALTDARTEAGLPAAYVLAAVTIAATYLAHRRRRAWWTRPLLVAALLGATGVIRLWDPVQLMTGVPLP